MCKKALSLGQELSELARKGGDARAFCIPCHEVGKQGDRDCHDCRRLGSEPDDKERQMDQVIKDRPL